MAEQMINSVNNQPADGQPVTEDLHIESEEKLVKSFDNGGTMKGKSLKVAFGIFLMVVLGVVSGYAISQNSASTAGTTDISVEEGGGVKKGLVVGSEDESTFKDSAEGKMEKGGVDGEGSHHLVRPGGESQNVYLTSSILDLDEYVGHEVKVWGETFSAQQAGWLMDVGRLEVLD